MFEILPLNVLRVKFFISFYLFIYLFIYLPSNIYKSVQTEYKWAGQKGSKSFSYNCPQHKQNTRHISKF